MPQFKALPEQFMAYPSFPSDVNVLEAVAQPPTKAAIDRIRIILFIDLLFDEFIANVKLSGWATITEKL